MAKTIGSTVQEVHRNFERLTNAGLVEKDKDGNFMVTQYGRVICTQMPSMIFLSKHKNYFQTNDFGDLPLKFIERIGSLSTGVYVKGFAKVLEHWKKIYKNAKYYVYEIHSEVPIDLIEPLLKKAKNDKVNIHYILSEDAVVPKGRKKTLNKHGFTELLERGVIERRMTPTVQTIVVLNEKDACVSFPTKDGEADISQLFYSANPRFHEWCLDYFRYFWYESGPFQESKLKEE